MIGTVSRWRWRSIAILAVVCLTLFAVGLVLSHRADSSPAAGPFPALLLQGKLTKRIAWKDLPVGVSWNGKAAGDIPADLQAVYRGQTLYKLIGLVDDKQPGTFNVALAKKGNTIRFIAADGYTWDMKSATIIGRTQWIVARLKNGQPLPGGEGPYRDVGSFIHHFFGRPSVKMIKAIRLIY